MRTEVDRVDDVGYPRADVRRGTNPAQGLAGTRRNPDTGSGQRPAGTWHSREEALEEAVRRSGKQLDAGQQAALGALAAPVPHGFYLWGDVGRGKTMLADLYAEAHADRRVKRVHIHAFLRELHRQIAGQRAPLADVLSRVLGDTQVLVFDEFHVHDVADAVFLTAVLEFVVAQRILLVATSNYPPQELLPDPLFHHRMEPAIALIEQHLTVVGIGDGPDHRIGAQARAGEGVTSGFAAGRWIVAAPASGAIDGQPGNDPTTNSRPGAVTRTDGTRGEMIRAAGIPVRALRVDGTRCVFSFADLCEAAVGTHQYLWLADRFDEVSVVEVPDLATARRDALLRFALLIDVLCDRDRTLTVRAAAAPSRLLEAEEPPRDATRTLSRLALLTG